MGDAGRGHPDANVVNMISSIWLPTLTAIGWLAGRAHSSSYPRLHQIELPPPLPTSIYKSCRASIQCSELVHDCHHYHVDDRVFFHFTLPLRNQLRMYYLKPLTHSFVLGPRQTSLTNTTTLTSYFSLLEAGLGSLRRLLHDPVRPAPLRDSPQHSPKYLQPCNPWNASCFNKKNRTSCSYKRSMFHDGIIFASARFYPW